jgi:uncharacterized 2Fe-2S/4Fe-4S cluster protein (DUF4445 family)
VKRASTSPRHIVEIEPFGVKNFVAPGRTILSAAAELGIAIRSDCGGQGRCGKCRVMARPPENLSPLSEAEAKLLDSQESAAGYRLACQTGILGPVTVAIPPEALEYEDVFGKTGIGGTYPVAPIVERVVLEKESPGGDTGNEYHDILAQIAARVRARTGQEINFRELEAMREASLLPEATAAMTLVNHQQKGITAVLPGKHRRSWGIALDIGTTTVAAYVCDLQKGTVLAAAGVTNPQRQHGEDVISRISFAKEQEAGAASLHRLVIKGINHLINHCLGLVEGDRQDIDEVTVVGNTTMLELLVGLHPQSLGAAPYLPLKGSAYDLAAAGLDLALNPGTNVHVFPVVSGFVGGDTLGAILAEKPHTKEEISLIIDIGTNGELVLGNREALYATSCATGPALEGAQLTGGMRASYGAIHRVRIDPASHEVAYEVLGGAEARPRGICGSGIIDAVAAMSRAGLLLANGRLKEGLPGVIADEQGIGRKFVLVAPENTATGQEIAITLADIRHIQLAKAALAAGIKLLRRRAGIDHIDRLILTGAFGSRFDWQNAVAIGMLPAASVFSEVITVENSAGIGAIMALLDKNQRAAAQDLAKRVRFLELAKEPDFAAEFVQAMGFPPG